ncbi:MAG: S8 family serine peptidase [Saprospiraceae bacterium]|nr:S8 family serine peptidase [Saprospiraceae bacterium]
MEPKWSKLDQELIAIFSNYLEIRDSKNLKGVYIHPALKNDKTSLPVTLVYSGDLLEIKNYGFTFQSLEKEGVANGLIDLNQLPQLSNHFSVNQISYGASPNLYLDSSVAEILARGITPGVNCVWSVNQSIGTFSGMTGENVIIGIIDTGIDWRHENFMHHDRNETRILSIWDQGLTPVVGENGPVVSLLTAGPTYGVEYTETMINAELASPASPPTIRHRDCNGHGTHVAGIAAGNGKQVRFNNELPYRYTGVAPKAKLVIVKYLYLENEPAVNNLKRLKDAITYINKIGERESNAVVINCSFGGNLGPHDGLIDDGADGSQSFLESTFSAAAGKICVFAASNDSGNRHHAIITIPPAGSVEIPFELYDPRAVKNDFNKCRVENNTKPLILSFWYRSSVAGLNVRFKPPGVAAFSGPIALGSSLVNQTFNRNKKFSTYHRDQTTPRLGVPLTRRNILINVSPHSNNHLTGEYTVKLTGPAGAEIHVWCHQARGYGFKLASVIPASVTITDNNTIGQPGDTTSVITVAAYNDTNDQMACFSSKGPLVDYSGLGVLSNKPDICAPGVSILSANSYQNDPAGDTFSSPLRIDYVPKGGTSMAAPHVAGLVALLLQKDSTLTLARVKTELNTAARTHPTIYPDLQACNVAVIGSQPIATANEAGSGKPDAKTTCNNI